jgi:hypothetical protein
MQWAASLEHSYWALQKLILAKLLGAVEGCSGGVRGSVRTEKGVWRWREKNENMNFTNRKYIYIYIYIYIIKVDKYSKSLMFNGFEKLAS